LPIQIILTILYPIVWTANAIVNSMLKLFRINISGYSIEPLSREELRSIVYETAGKVTRQYQNMLLSILDLSKLTVDDAMIPRHEINGIDIEEGTQDILEKIKISNQDCMPVFRENVNQIVGNLFKRDILRRILTHEQLDHDTIRHLLHEPSFVPSGTPLNVQLTNFQQSNQKIAYIVDEYGEIQGMLTLNDILEEIVGDFTSTLKATKKIVEEKNGSYIVDGTISVREFNRFTEFELPLRGPRTLNGLIVEHLESLPKEGLCILIVGYPIEIIKVKENRVLLAKVFPRLTNYRAT
jgi:Mg2+/Co2+ transporter CorB